MGSSCLELSVLTGLGCLFSFPDYGIFFFFFLVIISSDKFSAFLSLLLLGPYNVNISMLDVVPEVS